MTSGKAGPLNLQFMLVVVSGLCAFPSPAGAELLVQVGGETGVTIREGSGLDSDPAPNRIGFGAVFPAGRAWHTTPGTVILNEVPGVLASLTLTGTPGADGMFGTADDVPLDIIFDDGAGSDFVPILFEASLSAPIGPPAFDSASLNGNVMSANPLAVGVVLRGFTDAGPFGMDIGPFVGPGAFAGATGPIPDPAPPVTSLGGILSFSFDSTPPGQVFGDLVRLPTSAVVETIGEMEVPEPSTFILFGIGFLGLLGWGGRLRGQSSD